MFEGIRKRLGIETQIELNNDDDFVPMRGDDEAIQDLRQKLVLLEEERNCMQALADRLNEKRKDESGESVAEMAVMPYGAYAEQYHGLRKIEKQISDLESKIKRHGEKAEDGE